MDAPASRTRSQTNAAAPATVDPSPSQPRRPIRPASQPEDPAPTEVQGSKEAEDEELDNIALDGLHALLLQRITELDRLYLCAQLRATQNDSEEAKPELETLCNRLNAALKNLNYFEQRYVTGVSSKINKSEITEPKTPKPSQKVPHGLPTLKDHIGKDRPMFQDVIQFAEAFESVLTMSGLDIETNWARLLHGCFIGDNLTWVKDNIFNRGLTWTTAVKALAQYFNTPGLDDALREELFSLRMKSGESVHHFCTRYMALMHRIQEPDGFTLSRMFLNKLPKRTIELIKQMQTLRRMDGKPEGFATVRMIADYAISQDQRPSTSTTPTTTTTTVVHDRIKDGKHKTEVTSTSRVNFIPCPRHPTGNHTEAQCKALR